jgi:hypothetical protein
MLAVLRGEIAGLQSLFQQQIDCGGQPLPLRAAAVYLNSITKTRSFLCAVWPRRCTSAPAIFVICSGTADVRAFRFTHPVRMEAAIRPCSPAISRTYEIAELVGYRSPQVFWYLL